MNGFFKNFFIVTLLLSMALVATPSRAAESEFHFTKEELELDVDDATARDPSLEERGADLQADGIFPGSEIDLGHGFGSYRNFAAPRNAILKIQVYQKSSVIGHQFLVAYYNNQIKFIYPVSAGANGTPIGHYSRVTQFKDFWSSTHGPANSHNMDRAMYFIQNHISGWAIHATPPYNYKFIGNPASNGCVRLYRPHADEIYFFAKQLGQDNVSIDIFGTRNPPEHEADEIRKEVDSKLREIAAFNQQRDKALAEAAAQKAKLTAKETKKAQKNSAPTKKRRFLFWTF